MGPKPYCSNNMDGCDKRKKKKKKERSEKNAQRNRPYERRMKVSEEQRECGKATRGKEKDTCSREIIDFCDWQTQCLRKERQKPQKTAAGVVLRHICE